MVPGKGPHGLPWGGAVLAHLQLSLRSVCFPLRPNSPRPLVTMTTAYTAETLAPERSLQV